VSAVEGPPRRTLSVAFCLALAACASHSGAATNGNTAPPAANAFVGSWETAARKDGIVFTPFGLATFFNVQHHCPTLWAKYALRDPRTVVATGMRDRKSRMLPLDPGGLLRDGTTSYVYHRVESVKFQPEANAHVGC
jgi:hypothetical protein